VKYASIISAVYNSTTMSEMPLIKTRWTHHETGDKLCHSICSKWPPCALTQSSSLFCHC